MQGSGDKVFDEFEADFLEYLRQRFGVEREAVTEMLSRWLVNHPHRGDPGLAQSTPEQEQASAQALL